MRARNCCARKWNRRRRGRVLDAMIVDAEVNKYRNGGCFAMAEALHRLTGFPVRCIDFGSFTHAFVLSPEADVIDIHGRQPWEGFLTFLVKTGALPARAVEEGLVQATEIPNPPTILWRHGGYKPPSETAIRQAVSVARRHPNLIDALGISPRAPRRPSSRR